jgi:hypothetical protein
MGSLIMTKGTRRLISHLNKEFGSSAAHGNIAFYRANIAYFNVGAGTAVPAPYLYNVSEQLNIYPPDNPNHPNLKKRWQYFLSTPASGLSAANDQTIFDQIFDALHRPRYESITFDAIEDTNNLGQQVLYGDENPDINVSGGHKVTKRIVLVTAAMANVVVWNGQNVPLDDQDHP